MDPQANHARHDGLVFYIVGITETCTRLAVCPTEEAASQHIETLPDYEDGRYYIDACSETVELVDRERKPMPERTIENLADAIIARLDYEGLTYYYRGG